MMNSADIPIHTSTVMRELAKGPRTFNQIQNKHVISPCSLANILKFLRSSGFINIVIIPRKEVDRFKKAYKLSPLGRKMVPAFKLLDETEAAILAIIKS